MRFLMRQFKVTDDARHPRLGPLPRGAAVAVRFDFLERGPDAQEDEPAPRRDGAPADVVVFV